MSFGQKVMSNLADVVRDRGRYPKFLGYEVVQASATNLLLPRTIHDVAQFRENWGMADAIFATATTRCSSYPKVSAA